MEAGPCKLPPLAYYTFSHDPETRSRMYVASPNRCMVTVCSRLPTSCLVSQRDILYLATSPGHSQYFNNSILKEPWQI